jgi:hypothetical protein
LKIFKNFPVRLWIFGDVGMLVALENVKISFANKKHWNMKKTFMAMLLLGGTVSMFAQTTPATTPTTGSGSTTNSSTTQPATTSPTNSTGTTQQSTGTTNDPSMQSGNNTGNMNNSNTNNATGNNSNWNGVNASTSWTPETAPSYGWNTYSVWPNSGSLYPTTTAGGFPIANANASASMNSTGSYNAYGTAVSALPANVQMRFSQDFPAGAGNSYAWNQYGDWFHTHYTKDGRLWQYFYSQRGDGYALALPVVQTYVPENIINSALQKFGASLYSIGMVKTNSGNDAYQLGLLQNGQLTTQYFDENGATVPDVWRVEDSASLNSTQANAAMDNNGTSNGMSTDANMQSTDAGTQPSETTDASSNSQSMDANTQPATKTKSKTKIKHADGSETKIKMKDGETKVKHEAADKNNSNNQPQQQ